MSQAHEYFAGPVPADHPALACPECKGEGGWLEPLPASCVAIEPDYRRVTCFTCDGDRVAADFECAECGADLSPLTHGVGAIVEDTHREPILAGGGPTWTVRRYGLLCGVCAWEDLMADAEKSSSPPPGDR